MKSGYKEYLDQYKDLVNQPTMGDSVGDAFSSLGQQPAKHPEDFQANALLAGMGAGFKGAANEQRRQQLSPMLQQAGQITAEAAKIEAQNQMAQQYDLKVQEFGKRYTPLVAEFANAVNSNDPRSIIIFKDLVKKAGMIPGYENLEAESWDASKGYGLLLNTQTSEYRKITADEIISVIAPSAQAIYGEKWFEKFLPLNAGIAKDAEYGFNTSRQATKLGLDKESASIDNIRSQTKQHNASADKTNYEMNAPKEKYSKEILNNFAKENSAWVNATREEHRSLNKEAQAYEDIAKYIQAEVNDGKTGRAGSGIVSQIQRGLNKANTESEKNQVLIQYASQPLMQGLKRIYTGVTSDRDIALFLEGIPSLDKNAPASIQVAKERANEIRQRLKEDEVTREVLENDFGYSEPYNSLAVQNKVKQRLNNDTQEHGNSTNDASNSSNQDMVQVISPSGTVGMIPKSSLPAAQQKGYKIAQ